MPPTSETGAGEDGDTFLVCFDENASAPVPSTGAMFSGGATMTAIGTWDDLFAIADAPAGVVSGSWAFILRLRRFFSTGSNRGVVARARAF